MGIRLCIHSKVYWKGLIEIFNPKYRPWVKMESTDTEKIIEQIKRCPSGALSYQMENNMKKRNTESHAAQIEKEFKILVVANGPYLIRTECIIINSNGIEEVNSSNSGIMPLWYFKK